jgi:fructosamine-3-kinase
MKCGWFDGLSQFEIDNVALPLTPGFSGAFYQAYHEIIPRAPGHDDRHDLYTLYHYLNHYNMFGSGYYSSAFEIMERLTNKVKKLK